MRSRRWLERRRWSPPALALLVLLLAPSAERVASAPAAKDAPAEAAADGAASQRALQDLRRTELLQTGRETYRSYCVGCHGIEGDGNGPAAPFLDPKPRDFREGVFKFRSTPSGALPTDADLHRTLTQGVLGTSMPSWYLLPENQKLALIEYIKTFSDAWQEDFNYEPAIPIPGTPDYVGTARSAAAGRIVYERMHCSECHGESGKGDGPAAATLKDDWGRPIKPFDFTSGFLKGGTTPRDIYRTFSTGLNGSPMPSFSDILSVQDRWNLVSYILSLRGSVGSGPE